MSSETSCLSDQSMVIWSNLAFMAENDDECSSQDKYWSSSSSSSDKNTIIDDHHKNSFFTSHVSKEEFQLREELGKEIERELEREIMEGIFVLVKRLSNLKAKQILRSLNKSNLDEFLNLLHGSSNFDTFEHPLKADHHHGEDIHYCDSQQWDDGDQVSPTKSVSTQVKQLQNDNGQEEQDLEDSDKESTIENWSYLSE